MAGDRTVGQGRPAVDRLVGDIVPQGAAVFRTGAARALQRAQQAGQVQRDYYVRQLRDWKASLPVEQMLPSGLELYGKLCATTLARAHARSGNRVSIAAHRGKSDRFEKAIAAFAEAYADLNDRDHATLVAAIADGRLPAAEG